MKYQLAIRIPVADASADTFDRLLALENRLDLALRNEHRVDGHHIGTDVVHILVLTNEPREAFKLTKNVLSDSEQRLVSAACREIGDGPFTVIWPEDFQGEFSL